MLSGLCVCVLVQRPKQPTREVQPSCLLKNVVLGLSETRYPTRWDANQCEYECGCVLWWRWSATYLGLRACTTPRTKPTAFTELYVTPGTKLSLKPYQWHPDVWKLSLGKICFRVAQKPRQRTFLCTCVETTCRSGVRFLLLCASNPPL